MLKMNEVNANKSNDRNDHAKVSIEKNSSKSENSQRDYENVSKEEKQPESHKDSLDEKKNEGEDPVKDSKLQSISQETRRTKPGILKIRKLIDHWIPQTVMTCLTVYILFADDIKNLATASDADNGFSGVCVGLMFLFSIELILSSIAVENYFLGFYFWLDLISIASMLLDVHWFYNFLIQSISDSASSNTKSVSAIAKAGRGAKVGSRAIRILRILRIVRLVRISKLYKASEKYVEKKMNKEKKKKKEKEKEKEEPRKSIAEEVVKGENEIGEIEQKSEAVNNLNTEEFDTRIPEESKVGKKLSDLTTRRVIILVLSMMIGIILFNSSFYYETQSSMDFGIKIFNDFTNMSDPNLNLTFDIYVNEHKSISSPILYAQVGLLVFGDMNLSNTLRDSEKLGIDEECSKLPTLNNSYSNCYAVFDNRNSSRLSSILNMVKTIFICIVLAGGSICFSKDTTEMVLEPIEMMIDKIKQISKNPIEALQNSEKDEVTKALLEEDERKNYSCLKKFLSCDCKANSKDSKKNEAPLETVILENTITKIGALLALSFGEAGSEIIAKNMQNNSNGEVNPMIPGKKVMAIYGFCDIRNFTDTTEILQEKVMVFVNEIAEIVHEIASEYCGSANKNIGDAFLLVWKFEERFTQINPDTGELEVRNCDQVNQITDMALISFLKIIAKIHKSHKLAKYRRNEQLNQKFKKEYCVKLGFGLHLGWSIEGAIGSTFKIDASYLSPNVNMACKLEEKTKEYGVHVILSNQFYEMLSPEAQLNVRKFDIVHSSDGEVLEFYTVDLDLSALAIEEKDPDNNQAFSINDIKNEENVMNVVSLKKFEKYQKRLKRKTNYEDATSDPPKKSFWNEYEEGDEEFTLMRKKYGEEFQEKFNFGFDEFHFGRWDKAKEYFEDVLQSVKDGPSLKYMEIMEKHRFVKPADWKGNFEDEGGH